MQPISTTQLIAAVAGGMAMLILFLGTFNRRWVFATWVKTAFRLAVVAALGYTSLMVLLAHRAFPWPIFWALYTIMILFLGVAGGLLLLFLVSGEAWRGLQRWRQTKKAIKTHSPEATREA